MTGMLAFMGLSATGGGTGDFEPGSPEFTNESGASFNFSNPASYDEFEPGGNLLTGGDAYTGFIGELIALVTDIIAYPFQLMNRWIQMIANAGWAAAFIVVPSVVMALVLANAVYKIAKALPYT